MWWEGADKKKRGDNGSSSAISPPGSPRREKTPTPKSKSMNQTALLSRFGSLAMLLAMRRASRLQTRRQQEAVEAATNARNVVVPFKRSA